MFTKIISLENLLAAWQEFKRGKSKKPNVQEFYSTLEENLFEMHISLRDKTYRHGAYHAFKINDPKPRDIHKATVRDRLLHRALYRKLCPYFDKIFIHDSYSCRLEKGTHKAINRFNSFACKVSKNNTRTCWVLKCDIRKFFANIDHAVLMEILKTRIADENILWLLQEVISSFPKGLPLGNLTSQLLVNIYMNEFDQSVKHTLKAKYYIRYADDFVFLSHNKKELEETLRYVEVFLRDRLKLELHPNKVSISTFASGIDFLGWVHFPKHRVLRTSTKRRMLRNIAGLEKDSPTVQSYLGLLTHGNTHTIQTQLNRLL